MEEISKEYKQWSKRYHNDRILNLKRLLSDEDIKLLEKLNIKIKDGDYTQYEIEVLLMNFLKYYKEEEMEKEELALTKDLKTIGVGQEDYDRLRAKLDEIFMLIQSFNI